MLPFTIMFRILQITVLTLVIMYSNTVIKGQVNSEKIPIGKFLFLKVC